MTQSPAPFKNKFFGAEEQIIAPPWQTWLNEVGGANIPHHKINSTLYYESHTIIAAEFGRLVKFINGDVPITCTLPSVGLADIDVWITIMRIGTAPITIQASDQDTIETTSPGGRLVCYETNRICANLVLFLATETKWAILGGTGIWAVY